MNCINHIALVLPYYGVLPPYFNFYLRSLRGMNFDVLFFSDLTVGGHPENFKIVRMSFDEFKTLAAEKLRHEVRLDSPKRLCDFKPMYGKIFEDYLNEYDYWVFGDCDLLYGRQFDKIVSEAIAGDFDIVSLHSRYVSGPFCMIKNTERLNNLWRDADNWEYAITAPGGNFLFDEIGGEWFHEVSSGSLTLEDCRRLNDSFTGVVFRTAELKLMMRDIISESALGHDVVRMNAGCLTRNGAELPIFHYLGSKLRKYFTYVDMPYDRAVDFVIDDAGFYVTPLQKTFRALINIVRKTKAAVRSLRNNGLARLSPQWQKSGV